MIALRTIAAILILFAASALAIFIFGPEDCLIVGGVTVTGWAAIWAIWWFWAVAVAKRKRNRSEH